TDGFSVTNWSKYHDRVESATDDSAICQPMPSCGASCISPGRAAGNCGAERQRASESPIRFTDKSASGGIRAHVQSVKEHGRKGAEAATTLHARTAAFARWIRLVGRASVGSLPACLLPVHRAGEFDCVRRSGGAGEHEGDGVVHGLNAVPFG